jgi:mannitol 2-dehydrogenase
MRRKHPQESYVSMVPPNRGVVTTQTTQIPARPTPFLRDMVRTYMGTEATSTLRPVPGIDLNEYKTTVLARFANPEIRDTLARLGTDGSDRIPTFLLPVVRDNLLANGPIRVSAAIIASWARFWVGVDELGDAIQVTDQMSPELTRLARLPSPGGAAFLDNSEVFGSLAVEATFVAAYLDSLAVISSRGSRAELVELTATLKPE